MKGCASATAIFACGLLLRPLAVLALDVPAQTTLEIRLSGKISGDTAKSGDPVDAIVIAPVMAGEQFAIPAGATIHGTPDKVLKPAKPDERASLLLKFTSLEINGMKVPITAKLVSVDNAREKIDDQGQIQGILASETATGQLDAGLNKLEQKYSGLAGVLSAAKNIVLKPADTAITYDAGTEMQVQLTAAITLASPGGPGPAAQLEPVADEASLLRLVESEPFQTMAQRPSKPSDVTNVMLVGSEDAVRETFNAAGWVEAAGLNRESQFETFKALAESRGYSEAPVSVLLLDGKPPDLVFEKLTNTFSQRHHLRVWRRPSTFQSSPVWAVAATHDIGISFSEENRTFIHQIDSQIDRERAKVVNDLLLTGRVQSVELVDRPKVPQHGMNATGDNLDTDGKIAVLILK